MANSLIALTKGAKQLVFFILLCHTVNTKLELGPLPLFLHATAAGHINYMTELDKCFIKLLISNFSCIHFHVQLFTMESFFFHIKTSHYFLNIKNISPRPCDREILLPLFYRRNQDTRSIQKVCGPAKTPDFPRLSPTLSPL